MTSDRLSYAVVTPARNEQANLRRLAGCLERQTQRATTWIVVDNGSSDDTERVARELARTRSWIRVCRAAAEGDPTRGGPIVRAFNAGLAQLDDQPDIVVKLDADLSVEDDYFERLLSAFAADPKLGIASGSGHELTDGEWRQIHTTGTSVWGAARAYRRECLHDVLPLEERMGWDGIDELKARVRGWRTETLVDLPFFHHRREGQRDGAAWRAWAARGRAAWYMGYRPSYLVLRALRHARREPAALATLGAYLGAAARQEPTCAEQDVRAELRRQQRLRNLPARRRETLGRRPTSASGESNGGARSADVLLVCSSGGHMLQLWSLRDAWAGRSRVWVIASYEKSDVRSLLDGEHVVFSYEPTARNLKNLVRNALLARRMIKGLRPKLVLTTGAAVGVPFAWMGRLYGLRVVYVESLARATTPSMSCRLAAPAAHRVYVQWPELRGAVPKARYAGRIFADR